MAEYRVQTRVDYLIDAPDGATARALIEDGERVGQAIHTEVGSARRHPWIPCDATYDCLGNDRHSTRCPVGRKRTGAST